MKVKCKPRTTIEATVIRNDGTKEYLGVIADSKNETVIQKISKMFKKDKDGE